MLFRSEAMSDTIMALIFVTAIIALPFWEYASRKLNKRMAYVYGVAFWAVVQILLITVGPLVSMPVLVLLCVMAGVGISAAHVLPWAILPDAIEWDEYKTGKRHEGMFYSLVTLMGKIASSIAIPLTAIMLDVTGYIPNAMQQPESALLGIRLLVGPVPAIFLTISIIFALKYPLERAQFSSIVKELEVRRENILP